MSLEDEFDVEIPDEEIERIRTVGELVSYIEENSDAVPSVGGDGRFPAAAPPG